MLSTIWLLQLVAIPVSMPAGQPNNGMPVVGIRVSDRTADTAAGAPVRVGLAAQNIPWWPGWPAVRVATASSRYNRIEALSVPVAAGWDVGDNRYIAALLRLGIADLVPNAEVEYTRENASRSRSVAVFHRLVASNEWGNPLALGASLGALVIGRDEGFYYRVGGAELRVADSTHATIEARAFVERHRPALVKNDFSLADIFGERQFGPNFAAERGDMAGLSLLMNSSLGEVATELRLFGEVKLEAAFGDFDYSRGMFEGIVSYPLFGAILPSLTVSAGTSGGTLPAQRNWFLGGSRSARGQRAGALVGDAFWMTQAELGTLNVFMRPAIFFDAAWAGSRDNFSSPGRVVTGAGLGLSFFDGSLRFDLSRGISHGKAVRGALYFEARM
jgi:hypothetical protein